MPKAARLGDNCSGHGWWPNRGIASAASRTIINGKDQSEIKSKMSKGLSTKGDYREGDSFYPHTCPDIPETHDGSCGTGSPNVIIEGQAAFRLGDPVTCGGTQAQGSPNVIIN